MSPPGARRPLLPGRGVLLAAEFCEATGLDEAAVAAMVEDGSVAGLVDQQGRLFGLFDDSLPRASELRAMGHVVDEAYDPASFRSHELEGQAEQLDDQGDGDGSSSWSMQWPH